MVAHDWGGPIALGVAERHRDEIAGLILLNTAVQPVGKTPRVIEVARALTDTVTQRTDTFIRGATGLSRLPADISAAYRAPYADASRRQAIRDFVKDIPTRNDHASAATLAAIAEDLTMFSRTPVLLIWGAQDPVFSDRYLHDLERRFPHAHVERAAQASHLVMEDVPEFGALVMRWIDQVVFGEPAPMPPPTGTRLWDPMMQLRSQHGVAVLACGDDQAVTWTQLADRVERLSAGFIAEGIRPGDRVALLIPPSPTLIAVVYALWRMGACAVIADAGLGARHLRRCLRSAGVQHVIGITRGLVFARTLKIPGRRIPVSALAGIARRPSRSVDVPSPDAEAVVVFTSGATGPAKGVVYRQAQIERTRDAIASAYGINRNDALVAAFAPWAVLGPALGIPSAIPDMDLTDPSTLQATALADATARIGGTFTWVSPAALRTVVETKAALSAADLSALAGLRLVLAAGAPVSAELLRRAREIFPAARLGTPYGMTEVLPVCHVDERELTDVGYGNGVLVGSPLHGVSVRIDSLDGSPTGEVQVAAGHMRDRYDRRAALDLRSPQGWHATGDVGHLDEQGRLWIEGRLSHVLHTASGIVTPVGIEQLMERDPDVQAAALVGVGPEGVQQAIGIVVPTQPTGDVVADGELTARLRLRIEQEFDVQLAAILLRPTLPTDIRHHAKVDRTALAAWATTVLQGMR
jgi:acyl-CoA synthetase (AMP-forming)/AMP-acid ligase II